MLNKQPFYYRAVILFTATREIPEGELLNALKSGFQQLNTPVLNDSIEIEEADSEAGDPSDLM